MAAIRRESDRFADVIQQADPGARVPTCPEWDADDLLWHLTRVHAFWARILRSGAQTDEEAEGVEADQPERPAGRAATLALFAVETEALLEELAARTDDEPAHFWLKTARTVGSIRRMQAHEATMHRVDAELAARVESAPIDPLLALDGVRHGVGVMWAWWGTQDGFRFEPGGVVELRAQDARADTFVEVGRWRGVGQSGTSYDVPTARLTDTAAAAAFLSGTAEQLHQWLWGRGDEPAASGDEAVLAALRDARDQGMQ